MLRRTDKSQRGVTTLFSIITAIVILLSLSGARSFSTTQAYAVNSITACKSSTTPTNKSLLVVLLDRSGSLIAEPGATDPDGYSTSTTKALADLWPGQMAVIPFSNDQTPVLGPATLTNLIARTALKKDIDNYPIGGDTPLAPAMSKAQKLLQHADPGSRIMIITDGQPTSAGNNEDQHQENTIRTQLIPQFCKQGIPVSTFGLGLDLKTSQGQDANRLLSDIAIGTGGMYDFIQNPEQLGSSVIQLYAQWDHLTFNQITRKSSDDSFPVEIDSFANQVSIITFRKNDSSSVIILGPDEQPVTAGVLKSTPRDKHYEIDELDVTPPIVSGTYSVIAGDDLATQVYALVQSRLQVQIIAPTVRQSVNTGQIVTIMVALLDGHNQLDPLNKEAIVKAYITFSAGGIDATTQEVTLQQQGNVFSGQTPAYTKSGELQIEVKASFEGANRDATISLPIKQLPPPPSQVCNALCTGEQYAIPIIFVAALVVLLVLGPLARKKTMQLRQLPPD